MPITSHSTAPLHLWHALGTVLRWPSHAGARLAQLTDAVVAEHQRWGLRQSSNQFCIAGSFIHCSARALVRHDGGLELHCSVDKLNQPLQCYIDKPACGPFVFPSRWSCADGVASLHAVHAGVIAKLIQGTCLGAIIQTTTGFEPPAPWQRSELPADLTRSVS